MNNITTTILQDTAKNINKEYSQNGFGNGASGYIVIALCVCAIAIAIYYPMGGGSGSVAIHHLNITYLG